MFAAQPAGASGLLVPAGRAQSLSIGSQQVDVHIDHGIAVTTVTQTFRNGEPRPLEAQYVFPIPPRASVSNFSMWINGKEVVGEVLERSQARQIYETIVRPEQPRRTRKDPGLLEETNHRTFEMRVFPVPANGEQRIQITYYQPLDYDSGVMRYVYPLATDDVAAQRMDGPLTITVEARSAMPFAGVSCPTHPEALAAAQQNSSSFRAGIEEPQGRLDRDFVLYFQLERPAMGVDLFTHKEGREDGYFYLLLTPGSELDLDPQPLNLIFVIDSSGSMGEEDKLSAACRAAWAGLQSLRPQDSFNMIAFNLASTPLSDQPLIADASGIARAEVFLKGLQPRGGTTLVPALEAAARMMQPDRSSAIVLLSDGEATDGTNHAPFVNLFESRGASMPRVASIGVGNEVNRPLLDRLARDSGGFVAYLSADDHMTELAPAMIEKLRHPLASNVSITTDAVELFDLAPSPHPNLYHGGQLAVFGRYRGSGKGKLTLAADMLGERRQIAIDVEFPSLDTSMPEIQRMWAWHQIQDLMRLINAGQETSETQQQIVALGTAFSITSPYTSFLVLENEQMYRDFNIERRNRERIGRERDAQQARQSGGTQPGQHFYPPADYSPSASGGGDTGGGAISPIGLIVMAAPLVLGTARRRRTC